MAVTRAKRFVPGLNRNTDGLFAATVLEICVALVPAPRMVIAFATVKAAVQVLLPAGIFKVSPVAQALYAVVTSAKDPLAAVFVAADATPATSKIAIMTVNLIA